jgi:hypothetical protein
MAPEMDAGDLSVMHRPGGDRMILVGIRRDSPQRQYRYARIFDASLAPLTDPFPIGHYTLGLFALGGETVVVGDRWLSTWAQKPTHDRPRRYVAYTLIGPDGDRTDPVLLSGTNVDDDLPTVVSNGGESAIEAMIASPQGYSIVGYRFAAGGALIGGQVTLIDEPGRQPRLVSWAFGSARHTGPRRSATLSPPHGRAQLPRAQHLLAPAACLPFCPGSA